MVAKLFTLTAAALVLPFALSSCGGDDEAGGNLTALDESLANADDPALRGALEDQIVVDPELAGQSNAHAVRPGAKPANGAIPAAVIATEYQAPVGGKLYRAPKAVKAAPCKACDTDKPVTLGALAREQGNRQGGGCDAKLEYGMAWANRLPSEFPLYPKAKLMEAAGADSDSCNLRVASFVTGQPMQNVIDYYYTKALKSGFDAEHQLLNGEHVLGGVRQKDDGAYFITFADRKGGGTAVDIVANNGR
ncbi:hypothetical protein [Rhizorhapis sp. SPR117]|uniref:hypothetical protein n=1 Tax=Rhizorhapis sp. SPR117 TaxID=2912611 RepID=UPI001F390EEB|nr:hypothetical protein [Rhizorhapis sp. SPR117]